RSAAPFRRETWRARPRARQGSRRNSACQWRSSIPKCRLSPMSTSEPASLSQQLPRVLGPWMATAVVVGTVIGSGVFKKPYAVAKDIDQFGLAISAWMLVGLLAMMGALALAEVAIILP